MARPIEPTPELDADEWAELMHDVENVCTPEEAKRRIAYAERVLDAIDLVAKRHSEAWRKLAE